MCYVIFPAESDIAPHFLNGREGVWVSYRRIQLPLKPASKFVLFLDFPPDLCVSNTVFGPPERKKKFLVVNLALIIQSARV
jgi:hypothetical protein